MSAGNPAPLFTIVRKDNREDQYADDAFVDYVASVPYMEDHEEVELSDPQGEPAAIPLPQSYIDMDSPIQYSSGNRSRVARMKGQAIDLAIDFITDEKRRKLERMMLDRAEVLFTPGFGEKTVLGWRPINKFSFSDLTGKFTLSHEGGLVRSHYWDNFLSNGIMKEAGGAIGARIVKTPGGAGQLFHTGVKNIADPDHPTSSSVHGWTAQGTGITFGYNADGFGPTDAPGSLVVNGTSVSGFRWIYYDSDTISPPDSNSYFAAGVVFLRGYLGPNANIQFGKPSGTGMDGALSAAINLGPGGLDTAEWKPYHLVVVGDWTSATAVRMMIDFGDNVNAHKIDFEVGPIAIYWDGIWGARMYHQHWKPTNASNDTPNSITADLDPYQPNIFSMMSSFYIPSDYDVSMFLGHIGLARMSGTGSGGIFTIRKTSAAGYLFFYRTGITINADITSVMIPGAINTATVTRGLNQWKLYFNGKLVLTESDKADLDSDIDDGSGRDYNIVTPDYGTDGCALLTHRLDREVWSDGKVAHIDRQLRDPGSIEAIVPARGRSYQITAIPSIPRPAGGSTHWTGVLSLVQEKYDPDLADVTSKEGS